MSQDLFGGTFAPDTEAPFESRSDGGANEVPDPRIFQVLLDALDIGLVIIDERHRILHINDCAAEALDGDAPLLVADERLEVRGVRDGINFKRVVADALLGTPGYLLLNRTGRQLAFAVLPLPTDDRGGSLHVALVLEREPVENGPTLHVFAVGCGLTGAEERVLRALCDGSCVADAAVRVGCAENTARAHVRNVLDKTGSATLRALTARIWSLPPLRRHAGKAAQAETAACRDRRRAREIRPQW